MGSAQSKKLAEACDKAYTEAYNMISQRMDAGQIAALIENARLDQAINHAIDQTKEYKFTQCKWKRFTWRQYGDQKLEVSNFEAQEPHIEAEGAFEAEREKARVVQADKDMKESIDELQNTKWWFNTLIYFYSLISAAVIGILGLYRSEDTRTLSLLGIINGAVIGSLNGLYDYYNTKQKNVLTQLIKLHEDFPKTLGVLHHYKPRPA